MKTIRRFYMESNDPYERKEMKNFYNKLVKAELELLKWTEAYIITLNDGMHAIEEGAEIKSGILFDAAHYLHKCNEAKRRVNRLKRIQRLLEGIEKFFSKFHK